MTSIPESPTNHKEAVGHTNRIRGGTNLDAHPDFDRVPGKYFAYIAEEYEFRLRFGGFAWMITCIELGMEFPCLNQPPEDIGEVIRQALAETLPDPSAWLTDNLPQTTGPNYELEF